MSQYADILIWYVLISLPGVLLYSVIKDKLKHFTHEEVSSYFFSKVIFLVSLTYIYYVLCEFGHFKNSEIQAVFLFLVLITGLIIWGVKKDAFFSFTKNIFWYETVFLIPFLFYLLLRSQEPKIEGIEKVMDFGILNSVIKSQYLPPTDIWFSLEKINYYHFGHTIFGLFSLLSNIPSYITYNLSVATIFALSFSCTFALIFAITKIRGVSLLSALLLCLGGNIEYIINLANLNNYYFASARGLIKNAITEFTAYSFLIGDLHAHILNIPLVLLTIYLEFVYFVSRKNTNLIITVIAFANALLFGINSWDAIIYSGFFVVLYLVKQKKLSVNVFFFIIPFLILALPFVINFKPPVSGIGIKFSIEAIPYLLMFGHFIVGGTIFAVYFLFFEKRKEQKVIFVFLILTYFFMVSLASQILYLKDIYSIYNPPFYRANTIFKFWYQVFINFSIFVPLAIFIMLEKIRNKFINRSLKIVGFLLIVVFCGYFFKGIKDFYGYNKMEINLDGTIFLKTTDLNKYNAINFLNKNYRSQIIIIEKPGDSYSLDSTFSAFSGNPTPMGWSNHELGWRNNWPEIVQIQKDIENIYTINDEKKVKTLLKKYKVKVVVNEKNAIDSKYKLNQNSALLKLGKSVYENSGYEILEIQKSL